MLRGGGALRPLRGDHPGAAREEGVERTILFNLCGHGHFDMAAYDDHLSGRMQDYELPQEELNRSAEAMDALPALP